MNLYGVLKASSDKYPYETAVVYNDLRLSYRDLLRKIDSTAAVLQVLGLNKGDRIGLLMHNCPEFIICFYAAMKLGLISVSLNIMFKQEEVKYILNDAGIRVLIADRTYLNSVVDKRDLPATTTDFYVILFENTSLSRIIPYHDTSSEYNTPCLFDVKPEDAAVIAYTSGTTGFPKGAVHSHENIIRHLTGIRDHLKFDNDDIFLAALPFFQLVAFLIHAGISTLVGGRLVILEKFEADTFLQCLKKEKATFFAGVPTIYQMIYDAGRREDCDMSSVRFGICAGSPLSPGLRARFEDAFDFRIIHCYGLTEISLIAACEDPEVPAAGVSVGKPLPYIRMRLTGENGMEAGFDEVGTIEIRAERAMSFYWNNPSETQAVIRGGWFDTGDMGSIDTAGNLHIVDRKKDMIIRGGFNVYPAELERILLQDPRVAEAAVVGWPHHRLGEVPKAFVVLKNGVQDEKEDIRTAANQKLAKFKAIEIIEAVEPSFFPRNALGKILKRRLKQQT